VKEGPPSVPRPPFYHEMGQKCSYFGTLFCLLSGIRFATLLPNGGTMKTKIIITLLAFLNLLFPSPISSQDIDLGTLQKKEKERRKNTPKSRYILDNNNLNSIRIGKKKYGFTKMKGGQLWKESEKSLGILGTKVDKEKQQQGKSYWQARKKCIEADIEMIKLNIARLQSLIREENLRYATSGPEQVIIEPMTDYNQGPVRWHVDLDECDESTRNAIRAIELEKHRQRVGEYLNELEKHKRKLQVQEKKLNELYEEARRAGVPPGWLR